MICGKLPCPRSCGEKQDCEGVIPHDHFDHGSTGGGSTEVKIFAVIRASTTLYRESVGCQHAIHENLKAVAGARDLGEDKILVDSVCSSPGVLGTSVVPGEQKRSTPPRSRSFGSVEVGVVSGADVEVAIGSCTASRNSSSCVDPGAICACKTGDTLNASGTSRPSRTNVTVETIDPVDAVKAIGTIGSVEAIGTVCSSSTSEACGTGGTGCPSCSVGSVGAIGPVGSGGSSGANRTLGSSVPTGSTQTFGTDRPGELQGKDLVIRGHEISSPHP